MTILRDFNWMSKGLYQQMAAEESFEFDFEEKGILMLYKTTHAEEEELMVAEQANKLGIQTKTLSPAEVQQIEPNTRLDIRGAVHYPGDAHLSPGRLMNGLKKVLIERGVNIQPSVYGNNFELEKGKITGLSSNKGIYHADQYILAGGSWTPELSKELGVHLSLQAGKGYSFTLKGLENNLQYPAILTEAKIAVTPMRNDLRFGGTMEIAGLDLSINQKRVLGIVKSIPNYYPDYDFCENLPQKIWSGLRPCTPDGLPYIGKVPQYNNVVVAAGHAMMD